MPGVARLRRWGLLDRVEAAGTPPTRRVRFDPGRSCSRAGSRSSRASTRSTARAARCSTSCSSTPRARPAPRCASASPSRSWSSTGTASPASAAAAAAAVTGRPASSWAPTAGTPWSPRPCARAGLPRRAGALGRLLHVLGGCAAARRRDVRAASAAAGRRLADERRARDDLRRGAGGRVPRRSARTPRAHAAPRSTARGDLGERVRAGERAERICGTADLQNRFHVPLRPGLGARRRRRAGDGPGHRPGDRRRVPRRRAAGRRGRGGLGGGPPLDDALADYQAARDAAALPMYDMTTDLASFAPPRPEQELLLRGARGRPARDRPLPRRPQRRPPGPRVLRPAQPAPAARRARDLAGDALARRMAA